MRRFFLASFLFFLVCAALCHLQVLGFILKMAVKSKANSLLAYRELRIEGGALILEDAVLFDIKGGKSSYLLRSGEISLKGVWKWPLSFFIHVENPRITISPNRLKPNLFLSSKSHIDWTVEVEEGVLEWADGALPSSQFSLFLTSHEELKVGMSWEHGTVEVEKMGTVCHTSWNDLPFDLLVKLAGVSGFALPISEVQGNCSGGADIVLNERRISLSTSGKDISFSWGKKMQCDGHLLFDCDWEDGLFQKVRFSLSEGHLLSSQSEIREVEVLTTYRADLGAKCEGVGVAAKGLSKLPIAWEGKGYFVHGKLDWLTGNGQFGKAKSTLSWNGSEWVLGWDQLGSEEIGLLLGFVPTFKDWNWRSGEVQGEVLFNDFLSPFSAKVQVKDLEVEGSSFALEAKRASYEAGNWEIEAFQSIQGNLTLEGDAKWKSVIEDNSVSLEGEIAGVKFSGKGQFDSEAFFLSIPCFEGNIPPSLWPKTSGKIAAEGNGLEVSGSWVSIETWKAECRISEGFAPFMDCTLSNFECSVMADADSIDLLSATGSLSVVLGTRVFDTSFFAPRIQWKEEIALFDLRFQNGTSDLLRLKGGKEKERFHLDPVHSHFLGAPLYLENGIWQEGSISSLDVETEVDWPLFEAFLKHHGIDLWKGFPQLEKFQLAGHLTKNEATLSLSAPDWNLKAEKKGAQWIQNLSIGPFLLGCSLDYEGEVFRGSSGHVEGPGISLDFEGTMTRGLKGDLILRQIHADMKRFPFSLLEGSVEGQGCLSFTKEQLETDLDLFVKDAAFKDFDLENEGPLHLYYSTLRGGIVKGIDCRVHRGDLEAYAKIDLLEYDKKQDRWSIQKANTHIPSEFLEGIPLDSGGHLDSLSDVQFTSDFSEWSCSVKEVFVPIRDSLYHLRDLHANCRGAAFASDALVQMQGKWARVALEMTRETIYQGRLYLEEPERDETPLAIDWLYNSESGLSIQSIEGAFAGLDASFHALQSGRLIGSSRLDFKRLSEWIPPAVARSFEELKMGKGYELKGNLQIDPKNLAQISFQGIFSGKQIELAGFQFRTLLARADVSPTFIRIYDLKISDSAGVVKIDDIRIQPLVSDLFRQSDDNLLSHNPLQFFALSQLGNTLKIASNSEPKSCIIPSKLSRKLGQEELNRPWTIEIPKFTIEELRPSLLVKPGKEAGPISPLVVRQLKIVDFNGLLDDGKTWRARGDLSFINSFKREQTVFDLPANVFGRIIGLDLELLIPVEGSLTFELKDGYFNLNELKQTFSEGQRSQFFLAYPETGGPRMDLDGNLQILVKMKQFVLFSLTESFMISIEGKLNDPSLRLQKKKRFL